MVLVGFVPLCADALPCMAALAHARRSKAEKNEVGQAESATAVRPFASRKGERLPDQGSLSVGLQTNSAQRRFASYPSRFAPRLEFPNRRDLTKGRLDDRHVRS